MNRSSLLLLAATAALHTHAQDLPAPSPLGRVEQVVGLTTIKIEYSRPSARDRAVFGDLVPFGTIWRTGANACTKISVSDHVVVADQKLPPGKYAILSVPEKDVWTIHFNSDTTLRGTDGYDAAKDVLVVKAMTTEGGTFTETFTIGFDAVKDDHALLQFRWEKSVVSVPIHADALEQSKRNIDEALKNKEAKASVYHRSARFYLDRSIDQVKALEWAQTADNMEQRYWMKHTLALCLAANGKKAEAIAAAQASMEMAAKENDEQYVKMNKAKIEEWSK